MSEHSQIQWCDATWNTQTGCTWKSTGCANCYLPRTPPFRMRGRKFVKGHIPLEFHPERLVWPLKWKKPQRIFVNSLSDLFHKDVPDEFIAAVFGVMAACPQHTFQILTKRAERLPEWFAWVQKAKRGFWHGEHGLLLKCLHDVNEAAYEASKSGFERATRLRWPELPNPVTSLGDSSLGPDWPLPNVWLGISVEDQKNANERIPQLHATPAAVRFLSCEPLLGQVDIARAIPCGYYCDEAVGHIDHGPHGDLGRIDWVIVGGESGPGARPTRIKWVRSIIEQCRDAGVPCFVKQLGRCPQVNYYDEEWRNFYDENGWDWPDPIDWSIRFDGQPMPSAAVPLKLRDGHGGDWNEWPESLRVREFPTPTPAAGGQAERARS